MSPLAVAVAVAEPRRPSIGISSVTVTSANARVTASSRESSSSTRRTASVAQHLQPPRLAQQHEAKRVVELRVGQDDAFDRDVAIARVGAAEDSRASWSRTSGDALSRNQRSPSALTAADDWVRGMARRGSVRAARQEGHQQFHWGNPPPAAVPRRTTCTGRRTEGGKD